MVAKQSTNANILGDIRAESDHKMLDLAFFRTPDFLTLIESTDRIVVVGRRGTGKSALFYELKKHWTSIRHVSVITTAPQEEHMLGLRPIAQKFGDKITRIRAGIKIAWKYAMLMEVASQIYENYKMTDSVRATQTIWKHLKTWRTNDSTLTKLRVKLKPIANEYVSSEELIAELPRKLELNEISEELRVLLDKSEQQFVFLIDRLDEGYEPDIIGVGIIDGVIYGTNEVLNEFHKINATLFLRDNIFRAVAHFDPDFSRNVEGKFYDYIGIVISYLTWWVLDFDKRLI
ncbi:hypothetical protein SAMN05216299_10776 [Nitrosospira sp. Nsp14]|uniref:P-loop ATPase, Sll1717 family n=1 Tax=Nitrosospira sp. Nsp14 TaxID=1855333 RepID=UPI0008E68008|nr:hypothetical protein [Nitrosospira sp. Nsp14]SFH33765.1 hypothetical protein SAMN05216299_10776 [Nitrosospira sp. Nsp14]